MIIRYFFNIIFLIMFSALSSCSKDHSSISLLNVSYDVSRNFYRDFNQAFIEHYQKKHPNIKLSIDQSHGGSGKQAFAVSNGFPADVVTLNQISDINFIAKKGIIHSTWADDFPTQSVPFSSIVVFIVRKGNPKNILDWNDLIKENIQVIIANPKTSGTGRYGFLAAYGQILTKGGTEEDAQNYIKQLFHNVPILDSGARGATNSFVQREQGDALITLENEALISLQELPKNDYEVIYPSISLTTPAPVALMKKNTEKRKITEIAKEYLDYLWSEEGQKIAAENYLRPTHPKIQEAYKDKLPHIPTFNATDYWHSWENIKQHFFDDNGIFDQIYINK